MNRNRATGPRLDVILNAPLTHLQIKAFEVWLATHGSRIEYRRPIVRRNQREHDIARDQRELLLLQLELWQTEQAADAALTQELARLAATIKQDEQWMWDFGVSDGRQLGAGQITNGIRFFGATLKAFAPRGWENGEAGYLRCMMDALGYVPQQTLGLMALNDREDDHLLLAYMLADLADDHLTLVRADMRPKFNTERGASEWTPDETRALVADLGGRSYEVGHRSKPHEYLLDGEAMRAWAQHPRFYLRG